MSATEGFYVELPIETDAATLADDAIATLMSAWPAWVPVDSHLEVIMIEVISVMAQNAAEVAARMPSAALRTYGTDVLGVAYQEATPATTNVTFGLADLLPHTITDGTQIIIDGFAFQTIGDVSANGVSTTIANVPVQAVVGGTAANGLAGASTSGLTTGPWITTITVNAVTAGGTDAETDLEYQDRLSAQLQLQALTLITLRDYELWSLTYPGVARAQAITTAARAVSVALLDPTGNVVSSGVKAGVLASYAGINEINMTYTMADPTFTTVTVVVTVKMYPNFIASDVQSRINDALMEFFDPMNWGSPPVTTGTAISTWQNEPVVKLNKLIEVIGGVQGVNYVVSCTINGSAADLNLAGTFPLTRPGIPTITVT